MDDGERISALTAFLGCPYKTAQALYAAMSARHCHHKDILVHQGDNNDQLWLILDGSVQLQVVGFEGQLTLLATHGPGELFGAFPDIITSNIDIKVYGGLTALQIATETLRELLERDPLLGNALSHILGRQYQALMDRLASHVTLTAAGRVYNALLKGAGEDGCISPPPIIAALALTAQTSRETASRAVSALERRGIIARDKNRLEILSRSLLEALII